MREILFRGKLKAENGELKKGDWVYGDFVTLIDGKEKHLHIYGKGEVKAETIGQFTGLTDKNGKKIFEGDIIEWFLPEVSEYPSLAYIEYDESSFAWRVCWQEYDPDWLEGLNKEYISVIGNIHDNHELLENP